MSLLIFFGLVTALLLVSYLIYKVKGGGPKPAMVQYSQNIDYNTQRNRTNNNKVYTSNRMEHPNYRSRNHNKPMIVRKATTASNTMYSTRGGSLAPRIQILNKPTDKKIVVVRKSLNNNSYDSNNFLGYYNENKRGVLVQA